MLTILSKDTEDGKYGILDVRVKLISGAQTGAKGRSAGR